MALGGLIFHASLTKKTADEVPDTVHPFVRSAHFPVSLILDSLLEQMQLQLPASVHSGHLYLIENDPASTNARLLRKSAFAISHSPEVNKACLISLFANEPPLPKAREYLLYAFFKDTSNRCHHIHVKTGYAFDKGGGNLKKGRRPDKISRNRISKRMWNQYPGRRGL